MGRIHAPSRARFRRKFAGRLYYSPRLSIALIKPLIILGMVSRCFLRSRDSGSLTNPRRRDPARVFPAVETSPLSADFFPGEIIDLVEVAPPHLTDASPAASLHKRVVGHIRTQDVAENVVFIRTTAIAHGLHRPDSGHVRPPRLASSVGTTSTTGEYISLRHTRGEINALARIRRPRIPHALFSF
jgi:hypothetical protein